MSGCGSVAGASIATNPAYALPSPPTPGPGCTATNTNNTSCSAASALVVAPFVGVSAGGVTSSANQSADVGCAPDYTVTQTNNNKILNSTTVDQSVMMMTKNSLTSISNATNQMIVNSITNTTSSASQSATVKQALSIKVDGCAGDLVISDINQTANIQMDQVSSMTLTAIDNVRTDLATSILDQFNSNVSNANKQTLNADMTSAVAAQNMSSYKADATSAITQTKKTDLPSADPAPLQPRNISANVHLTQTNNTDVTNAIKVTAPYTSSIDFSKTLQSSINNSVTQNFTKDTVNILSQTLSLSQSLNIDVANIGGDCTIKNINQTANIAMRQTMSSKMDIGTAITNSIQNSMGIKTDDSFASDNAQKTAATTVNDLRSGNTAVSDMKSSTSYVQSIEQHMDGLGSSGSSSSSCICCIICIICILSSGLGGISLPSGSDSSESESETDTSEKKDDSDSSAKEKEGGFSFF